MDLSSEEQEKYLNKIFASMAVVYINEVKIIFRHPSTRLKYEAGIMYEDAYNRAIKDGLLPLKELELLIKKRGLFTDEDQKQISSLESKIEAQELLLAKTLKVKANQDRIKNYLQELNAELDKIRYKKYTTLMLSVETKAEEERNLFFCWGCTYKDETNLYWDTYGDLLKERDSDFKNKVLIEFLNFYRGIDNSIIRCLARSNLWRIRYVTSQKTSDPLFGRATIDYTNDMINLAYWSNFYQNIYEMMPEDRPTDSIIEDDEALDSYMKSYYAERNKEDQARRGASNTRGKLSAFDKEEVIVTQSNELYEDIQYDTPREAQRIKGRSDVKKRSVSRR
jgi:hypothetical protein